MVANPKLILFTAARNLQPNIEGLNQRPEGAANFQNQLFPNQVFVNQESSWFVVLREEQTLSTWKGNSSTWGKFTEWYLECVALY